ncbi:hypothetical protein B566_EDAN005595 [Ephemera danica]|nr:hypothetical protein B566_EDAN005595 [Ephemera danica]
MEKRNVSNASNTMASTVVTNSEGDFRWSSNDKRAYYTNWSNGEPNDNKQSEDCAEFGRGANSTFRGLVLNGSVGIMKLLLNFSVVIVCSFLVATADDVVQEPLEATKTDTARNLEKREANPFIHLMTGTRTRFIPRFPRIISSQGSKTMKDKAQQIKSVPTALGHEEEKVDTEIDGHMSGAIQSCVAVTALLDLSQNYIAFFSAHLSHRSY